VERAAAALFSDHVLGRATCKRPDYPRHFRRRRFESKNKKLANCVASFSISCLLVFQLLSNRHGRGCGVGRDLGDGRERGVGVGRGVGVAVGVDVGVAVGVAVGVTVGVGVGVAPPGHV